MEMAKLIFILVLCLSDNGKTVCVCSSKVLQKRNYFVLLVNFISSMLYSSSLPQSRVVILCTQKDVCRYTPLHPAQLWNYFLAHIWGQILNVNSTYYHINNPKADWERRNSHHTFLFNFCFPCSDLCMAPAAHSEPPVSSSTSVALWHRKI